MRKISADTLYLIDNENIKNGVLILDETNTIVEIGIRHNYDDAGLEIYSGSLCPGFINAHCHLELSHLKNKVSQHTGLVSFIHEVIKSRNSISEAEQLQAIQDAENEMKINGIVAVGDISNHSISIQQKVKRNLYYHTFVETMGFNPSVAETKFKEAEVLIKTFLGNNLSATIAPHAPYSTSDELMKLIFSKHQTTSIHNQECIDESNFFLQKNGAFVRFYEAMNIDISFFNATKKNSLQSIIKYFPTHSNVLFVHNTFADANDLNTIKHQNPNAYLCACANANLFIENTLPDYDLWINNFENICLGTDSLASNNSLSIWSEIQTIQQYYKNIPLDKLLKFATLNGAKFLGIDSWAGSIAVGKKPGLNLINGTVCKKIA